ncbi:hypothetical protein ONO23_04371 [Micromonospora noduli]|uniref:Integral membrane protein n=1 Tax=Micromonospora noduli TaxID=709876 RepID=A0A328N8M8_9ACTN|nr:hypothetical protein [Micromonospora noduli]KAB1923221.1 hypothetical protein F8280_16450 [Micromonospora noduli]RAO04030.1 hypothetical protein LAH08_01377 [Micromonospora noduli]RAO15322.1 hypothetical protein MED15_04086 [Micromonospora noduli]RAO30465.1 hypothetical protein ONO23_04371 [Micromonospora noduli]RAO45472.1 hypothetical protein ONO86_03445 [Micromonospora noduli]
MSPVVAILLLVAGLSEAAGRLLPVVARLSGVSHVRVVSLLLAGAIVDGAVFALWPLSAWAVTGLVLPTSASDEAALVWTPGLAAPLVLAGVLAFPLLGPLLHLLLMVGVGAGLAGALATVAGVGWWEAAGCVTIAGIGLGVSVEAVRRLVVKLNTRRAPEPVA